MIELEGLIIAFLSGMVVMAWIYFLTRGRRRY